MNTSYFGRMNSTAFKGRELNTVSIARGNRYWSGKTYPPLFPTWEMIKMTDEKEYEKVYREQVLSKLDAKEVYEELGEDAILLCHEKADDIATGKTFCHRRIVAKWLEEQLWLKHDMDVKIEELFDPKEKAKEELRKAKEAQQSIW